MTEVQKVAKAGETVLVRHRSKANRSGVSELMACSPRDSRVEIITAVYMDGKVRTQSGDVWKVKPAANSKTDWMTDEGVGPKGKRVREKGELSEGQKETEYLKKSKRNKERLDDSIEQLREGKTQERELVDPKLQGWVETAIEASEDFDYSGPLSGKD